jgi:hypothetical protein
MRSIGRPELSLAKARRRERGYIKNYLFNDRQRASISVNEELDHEDYNQILLDQLAKQPISELTGIVSASGMAGGGSQGDMWTLIFTLEAWRIANGPFQTAPITVRREVTYEELTSYWEIIHPNTVVRITARVAIGNVYDIPQAYLENFIGEDKQDLELRDYLVELQKPVIHTDEYFGELVFDRRYELYLGNAEWNGQPVQLMVHPDTLSKVTTAINVARELWKDQATWNQRVLDCVVAELLPVKNESWLEEGGSPLTRDEFERLMTLSCIVIKEDESFEFSFSDGDLFWGHEIVAEGTLKEGMQFANIHG